MRILTLSFAILSLLFFALPATAEESLLDIKEVKSKSGISAWLVEDHSIPVITMQFSFKGAGALQDNVTNQGLTRIASNMLDEGAGDLDSQAFQKELRDLSISLHFSSSRDNFGGKVKTLTHNKKRAFELLQLALSAPRFDDEPLQRMIEANASRLRSSLSDPNWMNARILNDVAFTGHPYALNSGGTLSTLPGISADALRDFVKTRLGKNNLRISIAGDITEKELAPLLDRIFGNLPQVNLLPAPDITIQNQGKIYLHEKDIPQTVIEMMQPGIGRDDPDYQYAQIMNFILGSSGFGSRLTEEIREKRGLTYGIYSSFYSLDHVKGLSVSTSTTNENVGTLLGLVHQEWSKMRDEPITQEELNDAKSYLIGALPLSLTSTDAISRLLLSLQLDDLPINYLDMRNETIQGAQIDDISRVSKRLLDPAKFVTVLSGKPVNANITDFVKELPNAE